MRILRNLLMVSAVTGIVAMGLYAGINALGNGLDATGLYASSQLPTKLVCPATGCMATACHGMTGSPPPSSTGQFADARRPSSAQSATLVCPATGCSAATCHATTGEPAPGSRTRAPGGQSGMPSTVQVCPATGCAATSCHATEGNGRPPHSGRGGGPVQVQPEEEGDEEPEGNALWQ